MATERSRDLERLITFVDAIVAIAITLLVLPLADLAVQLGDHESVATLLRHHLDELWGFLLSFVVITRLWFVQHRLLRDVDALDKLATAALMGWTLTSVFLPFPTALLGKAGEQPLVKALYIGTLAANAALLALLAYALGRDPHQSGPPPRVAPAVANVLLLLLALALTLSVPSLGYYPMILLVTDGWLVSGWDRVRQS